MKNLVYIVAIEFIMVWLLGFVVYHGGYGYHIFLITAIIILIMRAIGITHKKAGKYS